MTIDYQTQGTCASRMRIEVEGGVVLSLEAEDGCNGNLQGLSRLVAGMKVEEVIARLEGIQCDGKPTSCPDQLAKALRAATQ